MKSTKAMKELDKQIRKTIKEIIKDFVGSHNDEVTRSRINLKVTEVLNKFYPKCKVKIKLKSKRNSIYKFEVKVTDL